MIEKVTITPAFDLHNWSRQKLAQDWFEIQSQVEELGVYLNNYLITYIYTHTKREPVSHTLGNAFVEGYSKIGGFGKATVGFGIGNIATLNAQSPYWYVLNYGVKVTGERFIPGGGQYRPTMFGNTPADPNLRGRGYQRATSVQRILGQESIPSPIRPINYIQATQFILGHELERIIPKKGK